MTNCLLALFAAVSLHAATIRGNVVEHQTGKPLSRVAIRLQPLPGSGSKALATRTNSFGVFELSDVQAGAYLVTASRPNFVTVQYGQKQWQSAGLPVLVDDSSGTFLNIRMPHFAAISGRVVDENEVGVPHQKVAAYRNTRPPELAGQGQADERGEYRIFGLKPGQYLVRSAPLRNAEVSYIPTFGKDAEHAEGARLVEVTYDQDTTGIDIKPIKGNLINVNVEVTKSTPAPVTVTFATDMGRETQTGGGAVHFNPVPPGTYELYADGPGDGPRCIVVGDWHEVTLKVDRPLYVDAICTSYMTVNIVGTGGRLMDSSGFTVLARRVDLAGPGAVQQLQIEGRRSVLLPGRWELQLKTPPNYYVSNFSTSRMSPLRKRPEGWNEVIVTSSGYASFTVANNPGGVHGTVTGTSHETVAGAPVYLEIIDPATGARAGDLRAAITDAHGQYRFQGLPPGDYNILATFEYQAPDSQTMAMSRARCVTVREGGDVQFDLDLFVLQ